MEGPYVLRQDEIHLWLAELDGHRDLHTHWTKLLSPDERQRAANFHFEIHRLRFIAARAALRILLGHYLALTPRAICLTEGANGKPEVPGNPIHFNLSHSEDRALFAFSAAAPLGVDLEAIRSIPDALQIAASFFSSSEAASLAALPPERRPQAFFRCWTRKEAIVKALGEGLSYPLERFSVSIDEPACLLAFDQDQTVLAQWKLSHLEPHEGFVAAIATRQPNVRLITRTLGPSFVVSGAVLIKPLS
jgi:4'-phosphopantetheinyl transferase